MNNILPSNGFDKPIVKFHQQILPGLFFSFSFLLTKMQCKGDNNKGKDLKSRILRVLKNLYLHECMPDTIFQLCRFQKKLN
jgi:hypothetical protein